MLPDQLVSLLSDIAFERDQFAIRCPLELHQAVGDHQHLVVSTRRCNVNPGIVNSLGKKNGPGIILARDGRRHAFDFESASATHDAKAGFEATGVGFSSGAMPRIAGDDLDSFQAGVTLFPCSDYSAEFLNGLTAESQGVSVPPEGQSIEPRNCGSRNRH